MKKLIFVLALLVCGCGAPEKPTVPLSGEVNIIPQPNAIKYSGGEFELTEQTTIVATDEAGTLAANAINDTLRESYGLTPLNVSVISGPTNSIVLTSRQQPEGQTVKDESYELNVEPTGVQITGTASGLFYGVQTLIQMIPNDVSSGIRLPAAVITDAPRFRYRGFHLDEARHFMGADFVKKYIALGARYKLNYFHWHLTDDQGWRIPIEKYPLLTETGSRRPETVKAETYLKRQAHKGDGIEVRGSYTREKIIEIVAYAKARSVTIIPEIEMPGHSSAALAAYPKELGCRPDYNYKVKTTWGNPPDGFAEIICPSEQAIAFLRDVLDEVMDMFPDSPYIHVGGDETNLLHWKTSSIVHAIKAREGFTDEYQVLKWFIDRIASHVESRGKKIICWDDMIEKGQYPNATIMSWKGKDVGSHAARAGREVIMTPDSVVYFDRPQGDPKLEPPALGDEVSLGDVYSFDPLPDKPFPNDVRNIIGGQACVWTEFIPTPDRVEYMTFPRLTAFAEVLWSPRETKDFVDFRKRLSSEFARLDRLNVNYRIPEPYGLSNPILAPRERIVVALSSPIPGGRIYYTEDGSEPSTNSALYQAPLIRFEKSGEQIVIKAIVVSSAGRQSLAATGRYGKPPAPRPQPPPFVYRPLTTPSPAPTLMPNKNMRGNTETEDCL